MGPNDRHFEIVHVYDLVTLEDDTFGDITFDTFHGSSIRKIGSNAFNKTANKIKIFICWLCDLENQPPKYDLQNLFNQMTELKLLVINLNINKISTDFIKPISGHQSKLTNLNIISTNKLTIKSNVFQNLNQLKYISFTFITIDLIEKDAFKFINRNQNKLRITFGNCELTGKF